MPTHLWPAVVTPFGRNYSRAAPYSLNARCEFNVREFRNAIAQWVSCPTNDLWLIIQRLTGSVIELFGDVGLGPNACAVFLFAFCFLLAMKLRYMSNMHTK